MRGPDSRSWATAPMATARRLTHWARPGSAGHQALADEAAAPGGFEREDFIVDETRDYHLPCRPHRSRSRRAVLPCSVCAVEGVHSGSGAPPPRAAGLSTSTLTTAS